ncbi:hypothetical protein K8B33_12460 [Alcanivorax sp. JB21]|nr:hypothetical protein [Alcanivorax limicola]
MPGQARADLLVGAGFLNGLVGPNVEWAWRRTTAWVLPGAHIGSQGFQDDDLRWAIGMRRRMDGGTTVTSGFFSGLLAGDLGGEKSYERLGLGAELGHQWVSNHLRLTVSGGMAVLQPLNCSDYRRSSQCETAAARESHKLDAEPQLTLGVTLSLRR